MWKSGEDLDGLQLLATKLVEPFTSFRCISVLFLPAVSPLLLPHSSIMFFFGGKNHKAMKLGKRHFRSVCPVSCDNYVTQYMACTMYIVNIMGDEHGSDISFCTFWDLQLWAFLGVLGVFAHFGDFSGNLGVLRAIVSYKVT